MVRDLFVTNNLFSTNSLDATFAGRTGDPERYSRSSVNQAYISIQELEAGQGLRKRESFDIRFRSVPDFVTNQVFYATTYHPIQAGSIDGTDTAPHDNAVYRALLASSTGLYDPTGDAKAVGDPYCTLFVGRLARHTTEETLSIVMSKFGKVKGIRLVRHIVTGASQGYAFVEFENEKDMLYAYEMAYNNVVDGSQIIVDYNRQQLMPGWIPRRLGGGLGGRKESGQLRFGGRDRPFRAPLRPIPVDKLTKLGIPLPPVGRYVSRFLLPPLPRRPGSSREVPRRHKASQMDPLRLPHAELTAGDRRVLDGGSSQSPAKGSREDEAPDDGTMSASSSHHEKRRHSVHNDQGTPDYHKRAGKHESEKSHIDGERRGSFSSERVDEKEPRGRFGTHEVENSHRHKRQDRSDTVDEDYYRQRYQHSEHSSGRYKDHTEFERQSSGREGSSQYGLGDDDRGRRRSLSREDIEYEKSAEHGRETSKHGRDKREKKRSRSCERPDFEDIRSSKYDEGRSSKSRHGHEERKHKRRREKDRSSDA
ncbi:hypothetical protein R1flu_024544 [Riccia fluitans]|uniref:RRM domain-containing protein n=1 Tax=Riccia fluitans TaxID=41844 RepID=A0ABD1XVC7_9MARC